MMSWTKNEPTQNGYYWICGKWNGKKVSWIDVNKLRLVLGYVEVDAVHGNYCEATVNLEAIYFMGPIEEPELPSEDKHEEDRP